MRIKELEKQLVFLQEEKAWESSRMRNVLIIISTYIILGAYMLVIQVQQPWFNAVVPTAGFYLSTLKFRNLKKYFFG